MVPAQSPILLFDSGLGGLTVLAALRKHLPGAPVIYAADTAGLPYGEKTEAEIAARVAGLLGRMSERYEPRLICIACNTASTIALGTVREVLNVPLVGTVPAIKPAALATRSNVIGLLGTQATIRQRYVNDLEREFASDKTLLRHAAPELVEQAERKLRGGAIDRSVLAAALNALGQRDEGSRIDHIVLGCTHFPLLAEDLKDVAIVDLGWPADIRFVDGSAGIARRIVSLTENQQFDQSANSFAVTTKLPDPALLGAFKRFGLTSVAQF